MAKPLGAVAQKKIRVWREIDDDQWTSDTRLVTINSSGMYWDAQTGGWISFVGSDDRYAYFQDTKTSRGNRKMVIGDYLSILNSGNVPKPTPQKRYISPAERLTLARRQLGRGSDDWNEGVDAMYQEALKIVGER